MRIPCVAWLLLAGIGACDSSENRIELDENEACTPAVLRQSCVPEVLAGYRRCSVQEGACTWATVDAGAADQAFEAEWSNGARIEGEVHDGFLSAARLFGPQGEQCTTSLLQGDRCEGQRFEAGSRWFQYCIQLDDAGLVESYQYTCDDGKEYTLDADDLTRSGRCTPPANALAECVDDQGRSFAEAFDPNADTDADAGI